MGSPTGSPGYAQSTPDVRSPGQRRPSQAGPGLLKKGGVPLLRRVWGLGFRVLGFRV